VSEKWGSFQEILLKKIINYSNKICLPGLGKYTLEVRGKLEKCVKRIHLSRTHNVGEYMDANA
jgi:hypothetical protein